MTGDSENSLSGRRHTLLIAAVSEFIATAEPVGSHQIASRHRLGIKSAMVRNMMSELEDAGFLMQPHTSAGRVPTDKAFRYYVDNLAGGARIAFEDRSQIELHYSGRGRDIALLMRDTPKLLSLLTGQAAVVMAPRIESVELERVNFVRIREREVLAIFVATSGTVQSRLVVTDREHAQSELDRMANYLNDSLGGRTLDEARVWIEEQMNLDRARYNQFVRDALILGEAVAGGFDAAEVYVEGSVQALEQPEFADPTRVRELLRALDDKTALLELLERSIREQSVMVSIGSENPRLPGFSVVAAPYIGGTKPLGSLAIMGPVRMDYERVIPLVEYTARALSKLLEH